MLSTTLKSAATIITPLRYGIVTYHVICQIFAPSILLLQYTLLASFEALIKSLALQGNHSHMSAIIIAQRAQSGSVINEGIIKPKLSAAQ